MINSFLKNSCFILRRPLLYGQISLRQSEKTHFCLFSATNLNHPNLQIIVGGVATTPQDVRLYASCSLLAASMKCDAKKESNEETNKGAIEACVEWLIENEFISIQKDGEGTATCAIFSYSMTIIDILLYDVHF